MVLDRVDRRILSVLAEDGRTTCSELAQKVGLSNTPVLRRVRLLEQRGLIAGYTARLDETKLGYSVSVFVSVVLNSQSHEALASFEERVSEMRLRCRQHECDRCGRLLAKSACSRVGRVPLPRHRLHDSLPSLGIHVAAAVNGFGHRANG